MGFTIHGLDEVIDASTKRQFTSWLIVLLLAMLGFVLTTYSSMGDYLSNPTYTLVNEEGFNQVPNLVFCPGNFYNWTRMEEVFGRFKVQFDRSSFSYLNYAMKFDR